MRVIGTYQINTRKYTTPPHGPLELIAFFQVFFSTSFLTESSRAMKELLSINNIIHVDNSNDCDNSQNTINLRLDNYYDNDLKSSYFFPSHDSSTSTLHHCNLPTPASQSPKIISNSPSTNAIVQSEFSQNLNNNIQSLYEKNQVRSHSFPEHLTLSTRIPKFNSMIMNTTNTNNSIEHINTELEKHASYHDGMLFLKSYSFFLF